MIRRRVAVGSLRGGETRQMPLQLDARAFPQLMAGKPTELV
jgi:hypothetical protein